MILHCAPRADPLRGRAGSASRPLRRRRKRFRLRDGWRAAVFRHRQGGRLKFTDPILCETSPAESSTDGSTGVDMLEINRRVIEQFRTGGPVDGMNRGGLLLLTTTGRRTRRPRTTPMMFERDGEDLLVIASNVGAPKHPDWYLNLVADPDVTIEVGNDRLSAVASTTSGKRRDRVWTMLKERYPFFADHEVEAAGRTIPIVVLTMTEDS